jgi:hypothetical protein
LTKEKADIEKHIETMVEEDMEREQKGDDHEDQEEEKGDDGERRHSHRGRGGMNKNFGGRVRKERDEYFDASDDEPVQDAYAKPSRGGAARGGKSGRGGRGGRNALAMNDDKEFPTL